MQGGFGDTAKLGRGFDEWRCLVSNECILKIVCIAPLDRDAVIRDTDECAGG